MAVPTGSSFDANFYLAAYKDVKTAAEAAVKDGKAGSVADFAYDHWLAYGAREIRNPNAVFNTKTYLFNNADVQQAFNKPGADSLNPLTHYDLYGWTEKNGTGTDTTHKRSAATNGAFDAAYYTAANPSAISYGSPVAYFMAALRAAAAATSTTSLSFAASAYAPTVAYLSFDYLYYLQKNNDVAKSVLGDKGTVPATNTALTLIQKGKILYHWFNYGQLEGRVAHKIGSTSLDTASDFARITDPVVTAKHTDITPDGSKPSYTATALDDSFAYTTVNTAGTTSIQVLAFTVTGWGGAGSAFVWKSNQLMTGVTVSGVANLVFAGSAGGPSPVDADAYDGNPAVVATTLTVSKGIDMTFADATVTKLAVVHSGDYKLTSGATIKGENSGGLAFYNIKESIGNLLIQGLTGSTASAAGRRYELFGYTAAPADNTVNLALNNVKGADVTTTGINISSKSTTDIKTIKLDVQSTSSLTLTASDGDGPVSGTGSNITGNLLVEQRVSKLVITGGDKGVTLDLRDGVGTSAFDTLDVSGFKGDTVTYTATYGNHTATVLGSSAALSYKSAHAITNGVSDLYGQTFQFGTTDMGTNKAGTLAAVKTVGKIDISNIPAGSNIVDSFNLSTKIFGFTAAQWATIDEAKTYLHATNGGFLDDSATTAKGDVADSAATGNDSWFYILGPETAGVSSTLNSTTPNATAVDLSFGKTEAGKGHAAIVVLKDLNTTYTNQKMNIYFTDDNTKFDSNHAVLIGSYWEGTGSWGTGAGKIIDSSFFHIIA